MELGTHGHASGRGRLIYCGSNRAVTAESGTPIFPRRSGTLCGNGQNLHQFVRGFPELAGFDQRGMMRIQKRELLGWIRTQIHLSRLDAGMAEPQRDLADIAGGVKRVHRAAVSQHMRGHGLCRDRWGRVFGSRHMLPEPVG